MEKLSPEQRVAVAKKAAAARWAKPITQGDLKQPSVLQVAEWTADRVAQMGRSTNERILSFGRSAIGTRKEKSYGSQQAHPIVSRPSASFGIGSTRETTEVWRPS
jgi:hypothetical protein